MGFKAGKFNVVVTGSALGESKEKKTPQIVVEFKDPADDERICAYLYLSDAAYEYSAAKLKTLGWDPMQNGYRFEELNASPSPIEGRQVQIVINEEFYQHPDTGASSTTLKIAFINPPGGAIRERMPANEAKAFADKLRKRLLHSGGHVSAPPARAPAGEDQAPWEDDEPGGRG